MLSFNDLQEKKTKIKINPKKEEVMEGGSDSSSNCGEDCDCKKCEKKRRKEELGDETDVSTEETAYVSQEEVSEESDQSVEEKETSNILTFNQYFSEEGADRLKDRRMERGGVGGNQRYDKPVSNTPNTFGKKKPKGKTPLQKAADAKYGAGTSAMDRVKADIAAKYGKGAIMDTKKKG